MAIGEIQNQNDTPLGDTGEYRANVQSGDVFSVDDVPVWDGTMFAPGTNSALLNAYGGLYEGPGAVIPADGTNIDTWSNVTPIGGTPKQVVVDAGLGTILVPQAGDYEIDFALNCGGLSNNQDYIFQVAVDSVSTSVGSIIVGSNQVDAQSTSFTITVTAVGGGVISIQASGGTTFTVASMSFSVKRIG